MPTIKEGDRVRVVTREQLDEDVKSGLYYTYFGGLTGTVLKVYSKQEVSVEIESESLTREMRKRHEEVRDQMKTKWLDGLSEEGRNRLTEREKDFNLRYVVLVGMDDLEKAGPKPVPVPRQTGEAAVPAASRQTGAAASPAASRPAPEATPPAAPRKTLAEIEAAEEEELRRRGMNA